MYVIALASIRKDKKGIPMNEVLLDYYEKNMKGKVKKVALGTVIHKIVHYIFSILKSQTPYEQRNPKIHNQMYLQNSIDGKVA
ncbi:hypothetical protein [Clostridium gasigenes]|uniref:hypothetical protein n=1 Tax=Clostridium gasigenes TaxID=94869 RepID=UPI001C0B68D3|nr:hypothetical protein [Clostridium gasigenes]MBU3107903.1 hypothetical protein [Clostridium gasigenes]